MSKYINPATDFGFKRIFKDEEITLASYFNLSPELQVQYDDSFNNYLAYMGQQEYKLKEGIKIGWEEGEAKGRKEGRAEGEKIGMEKGERNAMFATARNMKADGMSAEIIAKYTGLTPDEITAL